MRTVHARGTPAIRRGCAVVLLFSLGHRRPARPDRSLLRALGLLQRQPAGRPVGQGRDRADRRAKQDGYTAILIADYKLQVLDRVPDYYFRNVEKVKAAAAQGRHRAGPRGLLDRLQQRPPRRTTPTSPRACRSSTSRIVVKERIEPLARRRRRRQGRCSARAGRLEAVLDSQRLAQLRNGNLEADAGRPFLELLVPGRPGRHDVRRSQGRPRRARLLPARAGSRRTKRDVAQRPPGPACRAAAA